MTPRRLISLILLIVAAGCSGDATAPIVAGPSNSSGRPEGKTIFQLGTEDVSYAEFTAGGFGVTYTCNFNVDCSTKTFPAGLYVEGGDNVYPDRSVERDTIIFDLASDYPDLELRLVRGGIETTKVVVDSVTTYDVTSLMLGSNEGFIVGSYNLSLGAMKKGEHRLVLGIADDSKGPGSYGWDALALIAKGS